MTAPGRGDGMLDIHGKCRREREELEAKLAQAQRNSSGVMAWNAEEPGDPKVCQYWQKRTTVESDWVHTMQWYGPAGSPIWIGQCLWCGWVDGQELADRIAKLRQADAPTPVGASGRTSNEGGPFLAATQDPDPHCIHCGHPRSAHQRAPLTAFYRCSGALGSCECTYTVLADSRAGQAGEEVG